MKKIITFILLFMFLIPNINALNLHEHNNKITLTHNIDNISSTTTGYITTTNTETNTIITSYNLNNLVLSQKQFNYLTNINIIEYNNNIVVSGIKPNGYITIHILDQYLRTINTIDTTINTTSITKINTYNNNNKLHILLTTDDYLLIDNIIYEIDETYNITNKNFVTYNEEELLSILKSDYYLIKNTYTNKDNENYYYKYSTYNKEYNILAGYKQDELLNTTNIITYINYNNELNTITLPNQILDIISINNELLVLNTDYINTYISKYDMLGNLIETVQTNSINKLNLISNNLVTSDLNTLTYYEYDCTINIIETPYGTLTTTKDPKPYEIVDINVLSNSGYEIETIKITDIDGNIIPIENNQFIMPNKSIYIEQTYKANVVNPETADTVLLVVGALIIITYIWKKLYKKYIWLK